jgi:ribose transport system permease protein
MNNQSKTRRWSSVLEAVALPVLVIATFIFFALWPKTSATFASAANLQITLGSQAVLLVIAMGALIPLVANQYDFSLGSVTGLTAIYAATAMGHGAGVLVATLIAAGIGILIGVINGVLVTVAHVNSVVATLGTTTLLAGVVSWQTSGEAIVSGIPQGLKDFATQTLLGIPQSFYVGLAVAAVTAYLLYQTPLGRRIAAIGENPSAANLLGIRVDRQILVSFILSGLLAGCAGVLLVATRGTASPTVGPGYTLPAIAAVFLGVAAVLPGRFNVLGTVVAILFLAVLNSGLNLAGAEPYVSSFANGGALIVGVALASLLGRRRTRT